jgi:hypothetical protein
MSFGKPNISLDDVPAIVTAAPPKVSSTLKMVMAAFVIIGAASLFFLLSKDSKQAWTTFQVNVLYWLMLSAASSGFAAVFQICAAEWSRPIRRIFESASGYLTFAVFPMLAIFIFHGFEDIFPWSHEEIKGKEVWLSANFLYIRDILSILLFVFLVKRLINLGLAMDINAIRGGLTGVDSANLARWQDKQFDHLVVKGDPQTKIGEMFSAKGMLSPVIVVCYGFIFSLIAWDQVMSVDPHWFSTLFGPFIFISGVFVTMSWNAMAMSFARNIHPLFKQKIIRPTLHDLGKLMFGFGIFWTYLFWSHYLTIWYGNLPEETGWIILRLRKEPWHTLSWFAFWSLFFFPFMFGLSKDIKQVPELLFAGASVVAVGIWLMFYIMIVPGQFPTVIPLSFLDLGVTLGFLGVFVLLAIRYLERVPLIPFGDMYR